MTIRNSGRSVDIVVVVPARNESARIASCLDSVRISLQSAVAAGAVRNAAVAVVGHHCSDDTLGRAQRALSGVPHVLVADSTSPTVGDVRAHGVQAALDLLPSPASRASCPEGSHHAGAASRDVWILNTDADSIVPSTWVIDVLASARGDHQAVIGLAQLPRRPVPGHLDGQHNSGSLIAYRRIIRNGLHGGSHDHVYGANLAVRADAYSAVGGFGSIPLGEDRALLDALVSHGRPVVRPRTVVVTTSDRRTGRAVGGLATLLDSLDRAHSRPTTS